MNFRKIFAFIITLIFFIAGISLADSNIDQNTPQRNILVTIEGLDKDKKHSATLRKIIFENILKIENSHIILAGEDGQSALSLGLDVFHFSIIYKTYKNDLQNDKHSSELQARLYNETKKHLIKGLTKKDISNHEIIDYTDKAIKILIRELDK